MPSFFCVILYPTRGVEGAAPYIICCQRSSFGQKENRNLSVAVFMLALSIFLGRPSIVLAKKVSGGHFPPELFENKKRIKPKLDSSLCWHYLSSRAVARQVLSAQTSLTSVFGMGTGGPSLQSIPTRMDGFQPIFYISKALSLLISLVTHTGFEPMLTA